MIKFKKCISTFLVVSVVAATCFATAAYASDTAANDTNDTGSNTTAIAETVSYPEFAAYLGEIKTCQYFTEDPVDEDDLDPDTITSATGRKDFDEVTTYLQ